MTRRACGWAGWALVAGLLTASSADAGLYFGDWGWCWHPAPDCPPRIYSILHYEAPGIYKARAWVHPSYLDEYPAGPAANLPAPIEVLPSACRSVPPMPSSPYANPLGYFGRQTSSAYSPP